MKFTTSHQRSGPPTIDLPDTIAAANLTPTESRLWHLLALCLTTIEICAELHISPNTYKFHQHRLYSKLNISSKSQAVLLYMLTFGPSGL